MAIILAFVLGSCKDNELTKEIPLPQTSESEVGYELVDYQGLKVTVPKGFPKEALNPTSFPKYVDYLKNIGSVANRRVDAGGGADVSKIDAGYLINLMLETKKTYPDISKSPLKDKDLRQIMKDIPSIRNEQDMWKNNDIVFDYYSDLIREEALRKALKDPKAVKSNGRTDDAILLFAGTFVVYVAWVGWPYAWMLQAQNDADYRVVQDISGGLIPTSKPLPIAAAKDVDGEKGNAYRHSLWNALGVKYMIDAGVSKNRALERMRDVATTYEAIQNQWQLFGATNQFFWNDPQQAFGAVPDNLNSAMDLNNNLVGRTYMQANTSWGIWQIRSMPSYSQICDEMKNKANSSTNYTSRDDIWRIYDSGTPTNGFQQLKWWAYDDNYRSLVRVL